MLKNENGKVKALFISYLKKMLFFGVLAFAIFLILIPYLKVLFKTTSLPLMIIGVSLIFSFILPVVWGVLQGMFRFKQLGLNNSAEMFFKLGISVLLVFIFPVNMRVIGALIAIPASIFLSFLVGLIPLRDIFKTKTQKIKEKETFRYTFASLSLFAFIGLMCSLDVILARFFFDPKTSGLYAGLSMIATSLFFIAMNAKRVMLPNITKNENKEEKTRKILGKTTLLIAGLFIGFLILSLIFPKIIILFFLGSNYLDMTNLLRYEIIAYTFFSLSNLLVFYNLAVDKNKKMSMRILASACFMQIALLILFHSTLLQFITMLLIVNILMFVSLVLVSLRKQQKI
jgi:O-antigen/teichoic acid export membrane protein